MQLKKSIYNNLNGFGHLILVHVVELHIESLTGEDHGPALADQTGADDPNFLVFQIRHDIHLLRGRQRQTDSRMCDSNLMTLGGSLDPSVLCVRLVIRVYIITHNNN